MTTYPCTRCTCPEYHGQGSGLCSNTSENGTICAHGGESHGVSSADSDTDSDADE